MRFILIFSFFIIFKISTIECDFRADDISAKIIPTFDSVGSVKEYQPTHTLYLLINNEHIGKTFTLQCQPKSASDNTQSGSDLTSLSKKLVIKHKKNSGISTVVSNVKFSLNSMENFGGYICEDTQSVFNNVNSITFDIVYFLPNDNFKLNFKDEKIDESKNKLANCQKKYGVYSRIEKLNVLVNVINSGNSETLIFKDFSKSTNLIDVLDSQIIFKYSGNSSKITIECEYRTIVGTAFKTKQIFSYIKSKKSNDYSSNEKKTEHINHNDKVSPIPFIIGFVIIIIALIITSVVIGIIVRIKKKKRMRKKQLENSAMTPTGSGSLASSTSYSSSVSSSAASSSTSKSKSKSKSKSTINTRKPVRTMQSFEKTK